MVELAHQLSSANPNAHKALRAELMTKLTPGFRPRQKHNIEVTRMLVIVRRETAVSFSEVRVGGRVDGDCCLRQKRSRERLSGLV